MKRGKKAKRMRQEKKKWMGKKKISKATRKKEIEEEKGTGTSVEGDTVKRKKKRTKERQQRGERQSIKKFKMQICLHIDCAQEKTKQKAVLLKITDFN